MSTVIGMFNHIDAMDQIVASLLTDYNLNEDDVEIIVAKDRLDHTKSHTTKYKSLVHTYNEDTLLKHLLDLGIPEADARFFSQGIGQGNELIAVDAQKSDLAAISNYLKQGTSNLKSPAPNAPRKATGTPYKQERAAAMKSQTRENQTGETFEVIEEDLKVGKRVVETGGVRVEKEVSTERVHEDVQLRKEEVFVDRKAVNRPASTTDLEDGFEPKSFELRERAEEVVVEKQARVVEEVTVGKKSRVETASVDETLRHVDIKITQIDTHDDTALRYDAFRPMYMQHYNQNYGTTNNEKGYERAYRYGHAWALDKRTRDYDFNQVEGRMRNDWDNSKEDQGPWEDFKDAVAYAWNSVRAKF